MAVKRDLHAHTHKHCNQIILTIQRQQYMSTSLHSTAIPGGIKARIIVILPAWQHTTAHSIQQNITFYFCIATFIPPPLFSHLKLLLLILRYSNGSTNCRIRKRVKSPYSNWAKNVRVCQTWRQCYGTASAQLLLCYKRSSIFIHQSIRPRWPPINQIVCAMHWPCCNALPRIPTHDRYFYRHKFHYFSIRSCIQRPRHDRSNICDWQVSVWLEHLLR